MGEEIKPAIIPQGHEWAQYVLPKTTRAFPVSDASTQWISELDPARVPPGAKCSYCPKQPSWLDRYLSHGKDTWTPLCNDHKPVALDNLAE